MTWYDRINGIQPQQQVQPQRYSGMMFQNPIQKANYIMQAMQNPAAFVRQALPGIPVDISNNTNAILQYMKQNCGLTDMDIQAAASQMPRGW